MAKLHAYFMKRSPLYAQWHRMPLISMLHLLAFCGFMSFLSLALADSISAYEADRAVVDAVVLTP